MLNQGDRCQAASLLLQSSGYSPLQIQDAGEGCHHDLFIVELDSGPFLLLRIPLTRDVSQAHALLRREAEAVARADGFIPVAYPQKLIPSEQNPRGILSPILPGKRGSDLLSSGQIVTALRDICQELGTLLARLHQIQMPQDQATDIRILPGYSGDRQCCLVHGDAHLGNLLIDMDENHHWIITGLVDWSFCRWGPPECDLVEMAICEAETRPHLGRIFYESYISAGGLPPREEVFKDVLSRELKRRLNEHTQSHQMKARDVWTRWLNALQRPDALSTRIFSTGRSPGRALT